MSETGGRGHWEIQEVEAGDWSPAPLDLDRLQIQRARLAMTVCANVVRQALAGFRWRFLGVPRDRAPFKAKICAARFGLNRAKPIMDVE